MKALKRVNKYFYKYRYRLIIGVVISIVSRFLAVKVPEIVKNAINIAVDYSNGLVDTATLKEGLIQSILIILGLATLSGFFTFLMRQTIIVTSRLVEFDLKNEIFKQYEKLSLNFYKKNRTGDLMSRISEDVSKVRMYFGPAVMYSLNMLVLFTVALTKMLQIDLQLTLYTLIPFPILSVSIFWLSKVINRKSAIVQAYLSKLTTQTQEVFSGINVIKSYNIERIGIKKFNQLSEESKAKNIDLYKSQALFFPLMILLIGISNLIVIYFGGMKHINGSISLGTIAEFIMYVNMLTWPVAIVGWVTSTVQQAEASQERINEFLNQKPEIVSGSHKLNGSIDKIEFKNVSMTYDDTKIEALRDINFEINKGEKIAILGKTGSGKSSLVHLLERLYDSTNGHIKINGVHINELDLSHWRERIGYVPQDPFLFSESIEDNIRFGKEDATKEEVIEAALNADVHDDIINFKEEYQTVLGERGITISGGQKQRLSLARALIKNPELFIFDDCLSAVDTDTEEKILNNLKELGSDKTTIIITHRVSSAKNADKIYVLNDGKILQQGTHEQLITVDGYYKEIYKTQLIEKEIGS